MKSALQPIFMNAILQLQQQGIVPQDQAINLIFERTRQKEHGDFATNIALTLAKAAKMNPRELAQKVIDALATDTLIERVEIAGPGFINIFLAAQARTAVIATVQEQKDRYGYAEQNSKERVLLEFVSANPTGPLHVGHGRGAAYGDALARVLQAAGYDVEREYYVNDAGRQMDILATSVWLRYLQAAGEQFDFPANCYQGTYIIDMAQQVQQEAVEQYQCPAAQIESTFKGLDDEAGLDALIALAKELLGETGYARFFELALTTLVDDIRTDLQQFGVDYDTWFSERSLFTDGKVDAAVEQLKQQKHLYEKNGAWWFKSTEFGDEKDRVVVRENGQPTYFASDIAYHLAKFNRGFDRCINIWGSDHHGYIPRVKAALQALNQDDAKLVVLLVQFAVLYRGGEKVSMSTRGGDFVELKELRDEVGNDAARFFYVQRKSEQHMDFDLDLAKSQSNENPVYYVQYAHARICSLFRQAEEKGIRFESDSANSAIDLSLLDGDHEQQLLTLLNKFPEVVNSAAENYEPHQITYYLRDLATAYHSWYNSSKFLDAEESKRTVALVLNDVVKQVLFNGLSILGVSAPEAM